MKFHKIFRTIDYRCNVLRTFVTWKIEDLSLTKNRRIKCHIEYKYTYELDNYVIVYNNTYEVSH